VLSFGRQASFIPNQLPKHRSVVQVLPQSPDAGGGAFLQFQHFLAPTHHPGVKIWVTPESHAFMIKFLGFTWL
jgi:hypothetical protein